MTSNDRISIAKDFSRFPAGRYVTDGPFSGERFRDEFLVPRLRASVRLTVDMDGTLGYGSSFLEEAFGGLVRKAGFSVTELKSKLKTEVSDPSISEELWSYIEDAGRKAAGLPTR